MVCGPPDAGISAASLPPLKIALVGQPSVPVMIASEHTWLGLMWSELLNLQVAFSARSQSASAKFSLLVGLVASSTIPLALGLQMFEACVDGAMRFGRWLYGVDSSIRDQLDSLYITWGKALLGADTWRNWAVSFGSLGWRLTGGARAVVDIAMHRARLWELSDQDLYKRVFVAAHGYSDVTWAAKSIRTLQDWGIQDWPSWASPDVSLEDYKAYVKHCVEAASLAV